MTASAPELDPLCSELLALISVPALITDGEGRVTASNGAAAAAFPGALRPGTRLREWLAGEGGALRHTVRQVPGRGAVHLLEPEAPPAPFLREILDHVAHPIFVKDRDYRFVFVNRALCEMVRLPEADLLGRTDYDFFPAEQADFFREKDSATFRGATVSIEEEPITDAAGARHVLATTKVPLRDARGEVTHLVGIIHDISQLKLAEEGLRRANQELGGTMQELQGSNERLHELDRLKSQLLANVSHEFRTPLTLNLAPLEELLAQPGIDERPQEAERLRLVYRNSLRLLHLVNNLLDFARLEAGRLDIAFQPVEVAAVTGRLCQSFTAAFLRKGLEFRFLDQTGETGPGLVAYLDPQLWEKVLFNLLSNALKFTEQGHVMVSLGASGGDLVLEVAGTGPGIPEQDLGQVFERFHRSSATASYEGTGLGLALVAEAVRLHGGTVAVASEPGHGTRFTVRLPLGSEHLPQEQVHPAGPPVLRSAVSDLGLVPLPPLSEVPAAQPAPEPDRAAGQRILVVDDNPEMRRYLGHLLAPLGRIETAADGQEGLERAAAALPDLVVADVMMPGLDGFTLCERLKGDPASADVQVMLLTARAEIPERLRGLRAGADDYVLKPFSAEELVARVRLQLQLSAARRRLRGYAVEQERLLGTILTHLGEGVMVWDAAGRLATVNAAALALTGVREGGVAEWTEAVALSRPDGQRVAPLSDEDNPVRRALRGHTVRDLELRLQHRETGHGAWVLLSAAPLPDPLAGVVCTLHEVSRLKEAERLKDEFLSVASHELRTPLASLQLLIGVFRTHLRDNPQAATLVPLLDREQRLLQRLNRLIMDILDVSRIQLGKLATRPRTVDLGAVVREAIERARATVGTRHQIVTTGIGGELLVHADPDRLDQVLGNLLANACKYAPAGTTVTLGMARRQGFAEVWVRDVGQGIAPELQGRIFERFYQVEAADGRAFGGLGLGLYISRELVQVQGGRIWVESADGQGSTFHFTVPLAPLAHCPPGC